MGNVNNKRDRSSEIYNSGEYKEMLLFEDPEVKMHRVFMALRHSGMISFTNKQYKQSKKFLTKRGIIIT